MKINVESAKIVKAVKKLSGIEVVLETPEDAKEAINLVLNRAGLFKKEASPVQDVKVTSSQKYETSAVNYKIIFLLEFIFEADTSLDTRVNVIREFQEFFERQ
jgi:hypothetical protein